MLAPVSPHTGAIYGAISHALSTTRRGSHLGPVHERFRRRDRFGNVRKRLEPLVNGGLSASIPLLGAEHMRMLWEVAGLDRTDPTERLVSRRRVGAFDLRLTGYKFETGLFSPARWLTNVGFSFLRDRSILLRASDTLFYEKVGFAVTRTIAEVCPLVDRVKVGEWLFVDQDRALSQSAFGDPRRDSSVDAGAAAHSPSLRACPRRDDDVRRGGKRGGRPAAAIIRGSRRKAWS